MLDFSRIGKTLLISFGNVVEWYDFCLFGYFGYFAEQIGKTFFNSQSNLHNLLLAFATFAASFLARPVGGIFFGYLGDRIGRYYAMNLAIITMGASTLAVSLLPGYSQIGMLAPTLLIFVRVLQGLSTGGQFGSLLVVTSEDPQLKHTGFYTGIALTVSVAGFLMASGVSLLVFHYTPEPFIDYSWRIPFFLGGILLGFYYWRIRPTLAEDIKQKNSENNLKGSIYIYLWHHYKLRFTIATLISATVLTLLYLDGVYLITFLTTFNQVSMSQALLVNTMALLIACLLFPLFGLASDRFGRIKVTLPGILIHLLLIFPVMVLLRSTSLLHIIIGTLLLIVLLCWIEAATTPVFSELFPKPIRNSGCCASFSLGAAISGLAPMLATWLTSLNPRYLAYFYLITLLICLIATLMLRGITLYQTKKATHVAC